MSFKCKMILIHHIRWIKIKEIILSDIAIKKAKTIYYIYMIFLVYQIQRQKAEKLLLKKED